MPDGVLFFLFALLLAAAWVGHACFVMATVNFLYGTAIHKRILKPFRLLAGIAILFAPFLLLSAFDLDSLNVDRHSSGPINGVWGRIVLGYAAVCAAWGLTVFPAITVVRLLRKTPPAVVLISSRDARSYGPRLARAPARGFLSKADLSGEALSSMVS